MDTLFAGTVAVIGSTLFSAVAIFRVVTLQRELHLAKQRQAHCLEKCNKGIKEVRMFGNTSPQQLVESIARVTSCNGWFLETTDSSVSDEMVAGAPFWIDPYLASMALRSAKTVKQCQLTQWGWAFAYIPVTVEKNQIGLVALATTSEVTSEDLRFVTILAELICMAWGNGNERTED